MIPLKIIRNATLFSLGGLGYVGLELLWRQRSHSSMFVLGGLCFLALGQSDKLTGKHPLPLRLLTGSGIITTLELAAGLLVNRRYQVWDYRRLPGNFRGQICLPYCLLWAPVSLGATWLYRTANRRLDLALKITPPPVSSPSVFPLPLSERPC